MCQALSFSSMAASPKSKSKLRQRCPGLEGSELSETVKLLRKLSLWLSKRDSLQITRRLTTEGFKVHELRQPVLPRQDNQTS